jgi:hypothetical protein
MRSARWDALKWNGPDRFSLDGVNFWLTLTEYNTPSTPDQFVFLKNRPFLESYQSLFELMVPSKILEVGIFHGAGAAFYDLLLQPEKIVCVDQVAAAPVLAHYAKTRGREHIISNYFGANQADKPAMQHIVRTEFPQRDIDLVIDDASHQYLNSRATFEAVFPYVRKGGMYVVEDWAWAHWPGDVWQDPEKTLVPGPALSNLVMELVMVQGTSPTIISAVHIDQYRAAFVRGDGDLPADPLRIEDLYLSRGRKLNLL